MNANLHIQRTNTIYKFIVNECKSKDADMWVIRERERLTLLVVLVYLYGGSLWSRLVTYMVLMPTNYITWNKISVIEKYIHWY
jgi:hypothetical protein